MHAYLDLLFFFPKKGNELPVVAVLVTLDALATLLILAALLTLPVSLLLFVPDEELPDVVVVVVMNGGYIDSFVVLLVPVTVSLLLLLDAPPPLFRLGDLLPEPWAFAPPVVVELLGAP